MAGGIKSKKGIANQMGKGIREKKKDMEKKGQVESKDKQKDTGAEREYLVLVNEYEKRMMNFRGQSEENGEGSGKNQEERWSENDKENK